MEEKDFKKKYEATKKMLEDKSNQKIDLVLGTDESDNMHRKRNQKKQS